jgi:hypothetical protein
LAIIAKACARMVADGCGEEVVGASAATLVEALGEAEPLVRMALAALEPGEHQRMRLLDLVEHLLAEPRAVGVAAGSQP